MPTYSRTIDTVLDLLSSTYRIRVSLDTFALPNYLNPTASDYQVGEIFLPVASSQMGNKVRRIAGGRTVEPRIELRPNPARGETELRFSLPRTDYASLRLFDAQGRPVREVQPRRLMESGRYAIRLDVGDLQPGVYLVELRTSTEQTTERIVVTR